MEEVASASTVGGVISPRIVFLLGGIGVGKTTTVGVLAKILREQGFVVLTLVESVDNDMGEDRDITKALQQLYDPAQDPVRRRVAATTVQLLFAAENVRNQLKIDEFLQENPAGVVIMERHPQSQILVFIEKNREILGKENARALITLIDGTCQTSVSTLNPNNPDAKFVLLHPSPEEAWQRIQKRKRPGEASAISREYCAEIHQLYDRIAEKHGVFVIRDDAASPQAIAMRIHDRFFLGSDGV